MATLVPRETLQDYVGREIVGERWITVDQGMIDAFADLTEDHQYIHVDPARARHTPFGTTIAHGFLTLSLISTLCMEIRFEPANRVMGINYGFDKIRFLEPVCSGAQIRVRMTLQEVSNRSDTQIMTKTLVIVDIRNVDKPALVAEWLGLHVMPAGVG